MLYQVEEEEEEVMVALQFQLLHQDFNVLIMEVGHSLTWNVLLLLLTMVLLVPYPTYILIMVLQEL
jgi:hypothetical protein